MTDLRPFVVTGLALGSVYGLSGIGLVVLYRTTAVLNFAQGAVGALGALVAWQLIEDGTSAPIAWCACIAVATVLSVGYGAAIAPRLADRDATTQAIATVGYAIAILGFCLWWLPDVSRSLSLPTSDAGVRIAGVFVVYTRVIALALAVATAGGVALLLSSTRTGLHMRAMADDSGHASMMGIAVTRVGVLAWALAGVVSGVSGLLIADLIRLDAATLTFMVVPAVAAAIIGRLDSLWLTLVGGLAIGTVESALAPIGALSDYRGTAPFVAALTVVAVQSRRSGALGLAGVS